MKALEQKGWSVWWNRDIIAEGVRDKVITEALNGAKCVVLVWSKESVISDLVKNEANVGKKRGILIPVLIDDVEIPLGFKHIQTASLVDWQGILPHAGFDHLSKDIAEMLSRFHSGPLEQGAVGKEQALQTRETWEEEHHPVYQQKVEVISKERIPVAAQNRNWSKIAVITSGIIAIIIAAIIYIEVFVLPNKIDNSNAPSKTAEQGKPASVEKKQSANSQKLYYVIVITSKNINDIAEEIDRVRRRVGGTFDTSFPDIHVYAPEDGAITLLVSAKPRSYNEAEELKEKAIDAGFSKDTRLWQSDEEYFSSIDADTFPVVASLPTLDAAVAKAQELKNMGLPYETEVYLADNNYYAVTLGGYLTQEEAASRVNYAKNNGIAKDAYVWESTLWGENLLRAHSPTSIPNRGNRHQ